MDRFPLQELTRFASLSRLVRIPRRRLFIYVAHTTLKFTHLRMDVTFLLAALTKTLFDLTLRWYFLNQVLNTCRPWPHSGTYPPCLHARIRQKLYASYFSAKASV